MKTIQLNCPKKVKKAIGLQSNTFEINQSSAILEKLKNYAIQNKSRITFGLKIINGQGEDEFEENFIFTSDSTTNLLVLLRQALFSENYSETPSTEKEKYLLEVENDYNQPPTLQETKIEPKPSMEPKTLATSQPIENESIPFWKGDPFKVMLIFDVVIACAFLWMINLHTLAILIPVVLMILGGIIIAFKKFGRKMDKKQTIVPANIIVQSVSSMQEEVLQPQIEITKEHAFPSASEPMSQEEVNPFPSSSEATQSTPTQDDSIPPVVAQAEPPVQPVPTFPKDSDIEPQPKPVFKVPHTVKSTPEVGSSIKSAEENRNQNLEWLSQQIQSFKDEEMQVIINKQRELEALHPETIEALNEAKDKIDEIYQLQLAFEKKWKVA